MGVSGCGKTTTGSLLSKNIGLPFIDADFYHSKENIIKMNQGIPLTDSDRFPWLKKINNVILKYFKNGLILACSALKEEYRLLLVKGLKIKPKWFFLNGNFELIQKRLSIRKNHFMLEKLLKSQYQILEIPFYGIEIDVNGSKEDVINKILQRI